MFAKPYRSGPAQSQAADTQFRRGVPWNRKPKHAARSQGHKLPSTQANRGKLQHRTDGHIAH